VEPPGQGWVSLSIYRQAGSSAFDREGRRSDFENEGRLDALSTFATVAVGALPGTDVWVQVPLHRIRFDDAGGERRSFGVGDLRLHARLAPLRALGVSLPLAVRGGVKLPAGRFPDDIEVVPLGDGQRDWELLGEAGVSWTEPAQLYLMVWGGHRWREENTRRRRQFGNERLALAALGGEVGAVGFKLQGEGSWGGPPLLEGLRLPSARRSLVQLQGTVSGPAGAGRWEAGVRVPVAGRNLPAEPALMVGYFGRVDLRGLGRR